MILAVGFVLGLMGFAYLMVRPNNVGKQRDGAPLVEDMYVACAQKALVLQRSGWQELGLSDQAIKDARAAVGVFVSTHQWLREEMQAQGVTEIRELKGPTGAGSLALARAALFSDRAFSHYMRSLNKEQRRESQAFRIKWKLANQAHDALQKRIEASPVPA